MILPPAFSKDVFDHQLVEEMDAVNITLEKSTNGDQTFIIKFLLVDGDGIVLHEVTTAGNPEYIPEKYNRLQTYAINTARFLSLRFWLPYLVNQCGSLLFNYLLAKGSFSSTTAIVNSLTLVITLIASFLLNEKIENLRNSVIGCLFICFGIICCSLERGGGGNSL